MPEWYFEDIPLNEPMSTGEYVVSEDEMVAFARMWDPLPIHTDPEAARSMPLGGLTAPALYTMGVCNLLGHRLSVTMPVIGAAEWKVQFAAPVRPGDRLAATLECVHKRVSRTRPDRGIARFAISLSNQTGQKVLEWQSTMMVLRRDRGETEAAPAP